MLVAIAIMAIVSGLALLTIPNHDDRYWRDNLDQLVSSLNMAQEESAMSGAPILAQVDSAGWRFFTFAANGPSTAMMGGAGGVSASVNGFIPDVYRPQSWYKPVEMVSLQLTLGGEVVTQAMQIPIKQAQRQAVLMRSSNGRFTWAAGVAP